LQFIMPIYFCVYGFYIFLEINKIEIF